MRIYIAGPMRGYPEFNFPAFRDMTSWLRSKGHEVFSPAERDNQTHGAEFERGNDKGSEAEAAAQHGFSLREALADDMQWIALHADAIYMLVGWEQSKGARAEHALAQALGLMTFYQSGIEDYDAGDVRDAAFTLLH
jgi:hypothetical protein